MPVSNTFSSPKSRLVAACLMALVTSTITVTGMTTYLPFVVTDKVGIPILLFPFIWTALFIYAYLAKSAWRAWGLMLMLAMVHGLLAYLALTGGMAI